MGIDRDGYQNFNIQLDIDLVISEDNNVSVVIKNAEVIEQISKQTIKLN